MMNSLGFNNGGIVILTPCYWLKKESLLGLKRDRNVTFIKKYEA
jgi:hypothetical protein